MPGTLPAISAPEEPATLQERKQQLVKDAIWEAATDLFDEKGYDETTIGEIAERAGVSRRSFFRYFSSKSDLMAQGVVGYGVYLTDAIKSCATGSAPREVFRHTVLQVAQQCAAHPHTRKVMRIAAKHPAAKEALSRTLELEERVEEAYARRSGERAAEDFTPTILAGLTLSVLNVIVHAWYEQGEQDVGEIAHRVLATLGSLTRGL
jgi:AcrR family transcriptional regulator